MSEESSSRDTNHVDEVQKLGSGFDEIHWKHVCFLVNWSAFGFSISRSENWFCNNEHSEVKSAQLVQKQDHNLQDNFDSIKRF